MDWIGAERILAVMCIEIKHFVTLEIRLKEGVINAYDCNIPVFTEDAFFAHLQPVLELLPILLRQSGIMVHLPEKLLNQPWTFKKRIDYLPKNESGAACGSYSLGFIEHLITRTSLKPNQTLMNDNTVERMQWVWAVGVINKMLEPAPLVTTSK